MLTVPEWDHVTGLVHGFFGRAGGVSQGPFASLNLSDRVGDAIDAVRENWCRVVPAGNDAAAFVRMRQVHGTTVADVGEETLDLGEADAAVTTVPRRYLSVLTADCVPILLVSPARRAVGVAHAGWRGTLRGIAIETVAALRRRYEVMPADLRVALGPAIGGCCYEVEAALTDELEARWGVLPDAVRRSPSGPARRFLDLRAANHAMLVAAGVSAARIARVGPCTQCAARDYFSHRHATADGQAGVAGRQLSFVGWRN